MFIGWNQWSKLRRFGESRQSLVAAQIEFSDNVPLFCFWKKPETTFMEIDKWSKKAVNHMNVKAPISSKVKASPFLVKLT